MKEETIAVLMKGMGDTGMGQLEVEMSSRVEDQLGDWPSVAFGGWPASADEEELRCKIYLQQPDIKEHIEKERLRLGITEGTGLNPNMLATTQSFRLPDLLLRTLHTQGYDVMRAKYFLLVARQWLWNVGRYCDNPSACFNLALLAA